jgi:mRNA interferase RelE/StbE
LSYRIEFRPAARRDLAKMDRFVRQKVFADIEKLADNPRPQGYEKLEAKEKLYRVHIGPGKNYRVIYQIHDQNLLVLVVNVGDRKEIYRRLK